ncbi:DUF4815 domain-containing protein [Azospirillum sp.]|uniref:DUF4815 domain-containing protein n=1 Tax=Azospirillum sp. TaxID=34012 RepID=UPI003D7134FF
MAIELQDYFSRYGTGDHGKYERHLFRTGRVVQSAELVEIQEAQIDRLRKIGDVLFKDGALVRDAQLIVNPDTGATIAESGALYLRGAVRGVPPASFTIPVNGTVYVGVYLTDVVVTELEDPSLKDPAQDVLNYSEPGAARLRVDTAWGYQGDGQTGEFYPVYTVVNGVIQTKEPPPQIDGVSVAIERYDRQSAGGYYVSSGLKLTQLADLGTGEQVYSLQEGEARINGREVRLAHAQRLVYDAAPDLKTVISEPHTAVGGTERVNLNHGPVQAINLVTITAEKVVDVTHGGFAGALDALPDTPVVSIVAVNQGGTWNGAAFTGGTTYLQGTDYKLTSDKVDWSLPGAEIAPGSSYKVVFRYIKTVTPTAPDTTGFTVTGAVPGTLINTTYEWALPRLDRLCLNGDGETVWLVGVASDSNLQSPTVPAGLLPVATVKQTWTASRSVVNDAILAIPMDELGTMRTQIDNLYQLVSLQALQINVSLSDPSSKKGVFADPFLDDDLRDQGIAQTAAIFNGQLMLAIDADISDPRGSDRVLLNFTLEPVLEQTKRSGSMKINPYQAFSPVPAQIRLTPEVDYWTQTVTSFTSDSTQRFIETGHFVPGNSTLTGSRVVEDTDVVVSTQTVDTYLRQITVNFNIDGFGPTEVLDKVLFDGIDVTPV